MLNNINDTNVLFLDIETVPQYPTYNDLPEKWQSLWDKKASFLIKNNEQTPENIYNRAGIYAEFGKIVCISVGLITSANSLRIKSFAGKDEKEILINFCALLNKSFNTPQHFLCAHNGKEFDFPYIARRCLINGIELPLSLDIAGRKPWEVRHLDTLELWKFGDYKHYTSLELLTTVFDIPTPKDDIKGSEVWKVFWEDDNLERIVTYCQKDVAAIVQLYLRYKGLPLIAPEKIDYV